MLKKPCATCVCPKCSPEKEQRAASAPEGSRWQDPLLPWWHTSSSKQQECGARALPRPAFRFGSWHRGWSLLSSNVHFLACAMGLGTSEGPGKIQEAAARAGPKAALPSLSCRWASQQQRAGVQPRSGSRCLVSLMACFPSPVKSALYRGASPRLSSQFSAQKLTTNIFCSRQWAKSCMFMFSFRSRANGKRLTLSLAPPLYRSELSGTYPLR